jgi:hypothetical protein
MKVDVREMECEDVDWIQLTQDRIQWHARMNTAMNLLVS